MRWLLPAMLVVTAASALPSVCAAAGSWSPPVKFGRAGDRPYDVSCGSARFCVAVGAAGNSFAPGSSGGFTAAYSGGHWGKPTTVPGVGTALSVSCPSASFCMAVGNDYAANNAATAGYALS